MKRTYLTDKEVASLLEIHPMTITRVFTKTSKYSKSDVLRQSSPDKVGNMRRWNVTRLATALRMTEDELLSRL